jgi:hypothetical protein
MKSSSGEWRTNVTREREKNGATDEKKERAQRNLLMDLISFAVHVALKNLKIPMKG